MPLNGGRATVELVTDRHGWDELRPEWNRAAERSPVDCPMLRHEWLSVFLDSFAANVPLRALTIRREGRLAAAAALVLRRSSWHGIPHRALTALANPHSGRFDVLAERSADLDRLWSAVRSIGGWDAVELRDIPEGGRGEELVARARGDGYRTSSWESMRTPFVTLDGRKISTKLAQNLRRRRRRLEELGPVTLREVRGGEALDGFLERGLTLEASGWKGRQGTAIACHPATRAFYRAIAREAGRLGWLSLYGLFCGERLAAFQFGLVQGGRYFLPKPAYDEALAACSPGQLLVSDILERCGASGLGEFDFLGPSMPWKLDWTDRERRHCWYWIYAPTPRGQALWFARTRLLPAARRLAKRLQGGAPWKR